MARTPAWALHNPYARKQPPPGTCVQIAWGPERPFTGRPWHTDQSNVAWRCTTPADPGSNRCARHKPDPASVPDDYHPCRHTVDIASLLAAIDAARDNDPQRWDALTRAAMWLGFSRIREGSHR